MDDPSNAEYNGSGTSDGVRNGISVLNMTSDLIIDKCWSLSRSSSML